MIVGITGPRPFKIGCEHLPNPTYKFICQNLETHLIQLQPSQVISGFAEGVDQWFAHIALKLNIPVEAAVPFQGQEKLWSASSQKHYSRLLSRCGFVTVVDKGSSMAEKYQRRNEYIVDHCDVLLAVFDESFTGGTKNCVQYARQQNKEIIIINPMENK